MDQDRDRGSVLLALRLSPELEIAFPKYGVARRRCAESTMFIFIHPGPGTALAYNFPICTAGSIMPPDLGYECNRLPSPLSKFVEIAHMHTLCSVFEGIQDFNPRHRITVSALTILNREQGCGGATQSSPYAGNTGPVSAVRYRPYSHRNAPAQPQARRTYSGAPSGVSSSNSDSGIWLYNPYF